MLVPILLHLDGCRLVLQVASVHWVLSCSHMAAAAPAPDKSTASTFSAARQGSCDGGQSGMTRPCV
jgi:hypothetical protein